MKSLANKYRPKNLFEVVGQDEVTGDDGFLSNMIDTEMFQSIVLYGPPGVGKTTISKIVASSIEAQSDNFKSHNLNGATSTIKDFRDAINHEGTYNILVIEEIHRVNKDKQDALLEGIEDEEFLVIGTTTENPNFALNPAIRSRVTLVPLRSVTKESIVDNLNRVMSDYSDIQVEEGVLDRIAELSSGDVRYSLETLQSCIVMANKSKAINLSTVSKASMTPNRLIDKNASGYHSLLSALQKSIRGYDVQAALHYLGELLNAGDLVSLERRLIAIAYEDIGLANPELCARVAIATDAAKRIGLPEAKLPLSTIVVEMCLSKHSRSAHDAINKVIQSIDKEFHDVPEYLKLNTYGETKSKSYDYNNPELWKKLNYLPEKIKDNVYYNQDANDEVGSEIFTNRTHDIEKAKGGF